MSKQSQDRPPHLPGRLTRMITSSVSALRAPKLLSLFATQYQLARQAIEQPPHWNSIAELEAAWHIKPTNRTAYIAIHRVYVALLSIVMVVILLGLVSLRTHSLVTLVSSLLLTLATCCVLLLVMSISLWRIDVLTSRRARSFVAWLRRAA